MPVWVTEVGLPVGSGASPGEQARTITEIYRDLEADRSVVAAIFHTLLEGESEAGAGDGFGWVVPAEDGIEPRPVYQRFADGDV
jgi:hypothetical protein